MWLAAGGPNITYAKHDRKGMRIKIDALSTTHPSGKTGLAVVHGIVERKNLPGFIGWSGTKNSTPVLSLFSLRIELS